MGSVTLKQLVYVSAARRWFTKEELKQLLEVSRKNNAALGASGVLLYDQGSFIQVLEGAPDTVERLFERIARDERHHRMVRVYDRAVTGRTFGEWSMGFASLPALEARQLPGYVDLLQCAPGSGRKTESSAARDMLEAFRGGRWRTFVAA